MALDATVGGISSNSYPTVEEADAYFEHRFHSDAWADGIDKASALITASKMLDWQASWKGVKTDSDQALDWPRTDVVRPDGSSVDVDIIPREVKTAVFELALVSISADRLADSDLAGLSQVTAGPLTIKTDGGGYDSTKLDAVPNYIWQIVSDLTSRGGISVIRLMRA